MAMCLDRLFNEPIKCPTCGIYVNSEEMDTHLVSHSTALRWGMTISPLSSPSSPSVLIPYPDCSSPIEFKKFDEHIKMHLKTEDEKKVQSPSQEKPHNSFFREPASESKRFIHDVKMSFNNSEYQCHVCSKVLASGKKAVRSHILSHTLHTCPICKVDNINEQTIHAHLRFCIRHCIILDAQGTLIVQCPQCNRTEKDQNKAIHHIHHAHNTKSIKCQGCQTTLRCYEVTGHPVECLGRNSTNLSAEQQRILTTDKINCLICHDKVKKANFSIHTKQHAIYRCPLCGIIVPKKGSLGSHITSCIFSFQVNIPKQCNFCDSQCKGKDLIKHYAKKHSLLCVLCNTVMQEDMFVLHSLLCTATHLNWKPSDINYSYENRFPHTQFDYKPTPCSSDRTTIISTKEFQCKICNQTMNDSVSVVRSHLHSHVLHECPICHTQNIDESQFDSHIKACLRYQPNPLQCPLCYQSFRIPDGVSQHIHGRHFSTLVLCKGCQKFLTCISLKNHPIGCLKQVNMILTDSQRLHIHPTKMKCVVCYDKIPPHRLGAHFTAHFLYTCLFCGSLSPFRDEILNDVNVCTSGWLGTQLNPIVFNCPFCNVNVNGASFRTHIQDEHIHLCPLCNTVIANKLLTHHGLMCTVNNLDRVSSSAQDNHQLTEPPLDPMDTIPPLADSTEVSDQHTCLYPVNTDSPVSDFLCPFCDTKHSSSVDLISSHLLSCVNIPSDLHIVALPNLVGFRLN